MLRLADLREILRYVPQYRDKFFVVAVDGVIVDGPVNCNCWFSGVFFSNTV